MARSDATEGPAGDIDEHSQFQESKIYRYKLQWMM